MHSYIGSKKTQLGYGLLLIDVRGSLSASSLVTEALKQEKPCGVISKTRKSAIL